MRQLTACIKKRSAWKRLNKPNQAGAGTNHPGAKPKGAKMKELQYEIQRTKTRLDKLRASIQRDAQTSLFHGIQITLELGADPRLETARRLEKEIVELEMQIELIRKRKELEEHYRQTAENMHIFGEVQ